MIYFPENLDDWRRIASYIGCSENVFISTHVNPDGDAIGSEMALAGFFLRMGKSFRVMNHSVTPEAFKFLDPQGIIESFPKYAPKNNGPKKTDLVIFLDLGKYDRIGNCEYFLTTNDAPKIIIDHHPPESVEVDLKVVNPRADSTGSLLYDFMKHTDSTLINVDIAQALLTAIVTDTGYFRYSNTTAITHLITASLYEYGVTPSDIYENLEKGFPLCRQKLLGFTLSNVTVNPSGTIAYALITDSMFKKAGAQREHTEGIIDHLRFIKGIKIAVLIIQEGVDRYKVSLRSAGTANVHVIASMLGGGGHPKAAGATLTGSLDFVIARILEITEAHM